MMHGWIRTFSIIVTLLVVSVLAPSLHVYANNVTNLQLPFGVFLKEGAAFAAASALVAAAAFWLTPGPWRRRAGLTLLYVSCCSWFMTNFVLYDYGFLDGDTPDWSGGDLIGFGELAGAFLLGLLFVRFRRQAWKNAVFISCLLILSSLVYLPVLLSEIDRAPAKNYAFTKQGIYTLSRQQNVLVFVLDTLQTDVVNEILAEDEKWAADLSGFTLFRNGVSAFPKTYASVPALLTGQAFDNSQPMSEYMGQSFRQKSLPAQLKSAGFDARLWTFVPQTLLADPLVADNVQLNELEGSGPDPWVTDRQLIADMTLFRIAPHFLKSWVYNDGLFRAGGIPWRGLMPIIGDSTETGHPQECSLPEDQRRYSKQLRTFDTNFLDEFLACTNASLERPAFRFYHLNAGHHPFRFDRSYAYVGTREVNRQSYRDQVEGILTAMVTLFGRLRSLGIYENSTVLVLSDHGYGEGRVGINDSLAGLPPGTGQSSGDVPGNHVWGALAAVLVKPANATGELRISDAPVQLTDIPATVMDILGMHSEGGGMSMYKVEENQQRKRVHRFYRYAGWNIDYILPMIEYEVDGFSWRMESWRRSGRDFEAEVQASHQGFLLNLATEKTRLQGGWSSPAADSRTIEDDHALADLSTDLQGPMILRLLHAPFKAAGEEQRTLSLHAGERSLGSFRLASEDGQFEKARVLSDEDLAMLRHELFGLRLDKPAPWLQLRQIRLEPLDRFSYRLGETLRFSARGTGKRFQTFGWHQPASEGVPSLGRSSGVVLSTGLAIDSRWTLELALEPYVYEGWPQQNMRVFANDVALGELSFDQRREYRVNLPLDRLAGLDSRWLDIRFEFDTPVRPAWINPRWENRLRAIILKEIRVSDSPAQRP